MHSRLVLVVLGVVLMASFAHASFRHHPRVPMRHNRAPQDPPIPPINFTCPKLPPAPPATDVRKLRFNNIKVVMALGDSISAGFSMKSRKVDQEFFEWRGDVFSIGGDEGAPTIPNWLKAVGAVTEGQSYGITYPLKKGSRLDGAVSEAQIQHVPEQVDYLIKELKGTYAHKVDFEKDWKLLTLFIGANNMCSGSHSHDADFYEAQLRSVINQVYTNIPRVFMNVMTLFNISQVWDVGHTDSYCSWVFEHVDECPRLYKAADRMQMDIDTQAMNQRIYKVVNEWQAKNLANFTVVVQPGLENLIVPSENFLSNLDCFHPNQYADEAFALAIWNNMNVPTDKKQTTIDILNPPPPLCPAADQYIQ